jgi:hypothetical protein
MDVNDDEPGKKTGLDFPLATIITSNEECHK